MKDREEGLKLACLNVVPPHVPGFRYVADYLLYRLNNMGCFDYVNEFFLDGPTNDVTKVMKNSSPIFVQLSAQIWKIMAAESTLGSQGDRGSASQLFDELDDLISAYEHFLSRFWKGHLGRICLDEVPDVAELAYRAELCIR